MDGRKLISTFILMMGVVNDVQTQYIPRVSIPQSVINGDLGVPVTIPCEIDANPRVNNVIWTKIPGGVTATLPVPPGKYRGGTPTTPALTIDNLAKSDAAQYRCEATNSIGTAQSNIVTVIVNYIPTDIQVSPQSVQMQENENASVTCTADGVPTPTYAWYFESNTQSISASQTLTITSAKASDNGKYTCRAINSKGYADHIVRISVWYAPILTTNPSPQIVDKGSSLTILCSINSNPIPFKVIWEKDGVEVDRSDTRISGGANTTDPHLTIANLQTSDVGSYSCTVNNVAGTTISDNVEIRLSSPPGNVVLSPPNSTFSLIEGDTLTIYCSSTGEPTPKYTWLTGNDVIGVGSSIVILSASPDDNREVTCRVENIKGFATKTARINVQYKPRGSGKVFRAAIDEEVTLTCVTDANPPADTYQWSFDDVTLSETGSSLQVTLSDDSYFGDYLCVAINKIASSEPITFTIERETNPPETVSAAGLSTPIIVLIVLLVLLLIIIIVVLVYVIHIKRCCRKERKSKVTPKIKENEREITPTALVKPITENSSSGARTTEWKTEHKPPEEDEVDNKPQPEPNKMSVGDQMQIEESVPTSAIDGGMIISLFDSGKAQAHHLAPEAQENKKKRKRKKKHREGEITDKPIGSALKIEDEE